MSVTSKTETTKNAEAAFAGESQANRKYLFFAQKADEDGFKQAARLFRAAADAETVHARNHLRVLGGVKTTGENLEAAVAGEHWEFTKMYPDFIKQAEIDGDAKAKSSFDYANQVEKVHHRLFESALKAVSKDGDRVAMTHIFVCQTCGNTVEGEAPNICPICSSAKSMFKKID